MQSEQNGTKSTEYVIDLLPGQIAMFGYGSLLLQRSMEQTLGHVYSQICVPCELIGWRRSFNVMMPNRSFYEPVDGTEEAALIPKHIVYLNIRPSNQDRVNGLLYVLKSDQIESFDAREWIYDRYEVTSALKGVTLRGGSAYAYVGKPEWCINPEAEIRDHAALRSSYMQIVEEGLRELGQGFRAQYEQSTDSLPTHLLFADSRREGIAKAQFQGEVEPGEPPLKR
jgi:cation transport regulator ChaC